MLFFKTCYVNTSKGVDVVQITDDLKYAIRDSKSPEGLLTVISPKAGVGFLLMPNIDELKNELKNTFEVFGSETGSAKDKLKRERNIGPILQSAILGRSMTLPFREQQLLIDHYDEVFLVDFEETPSRRDFMIQIISEAPAAEQPKQKGKR